MVIRRWKNEKKVLRELFKKETLQEIEETPKEETSKKKPIGKRLK